MRQSAFVETYGDLAALDKVTTLQSLLNEAGRIFARSGGSHTLASLIHTARTPRSVRRQNILFNNCSREWLDRYIECNYIYEDPTYKRGSMAHGPQYWSTIRAAMSNRVEFDIFDLAASFGMKDGVTFVVPTADSSVGILTIAGERISDAPSDRAQLALVTQYAIGKAIALRTATGRYGNEFELTQREREILLWASEGKTDWEIGAILGISQFTADKYMRRLKEKLNASTRTHVIARALRLGLI